jgi:threonine aldolase
MQNTHNKCGGVPVSVEFTDALGALAKRHGLAMHIDGARICNAAAALGVAPARLAAAADSVSVCLSKGLGAPVGTVLVGPADFIRKARRLRKALGGGMRQAGIIAAAGIVALRDILPRLPDDHANMARLAAGLATVPGVALRGGVAPPTNIAYLDLSPAIDFPKLQAGLRARGIAANGAPGLMRVVTHHQVSAADVDEVIAAFRELCTPAVAAHAKLLAVQQQVAQQFGSPPPR